MAYQNVTLRHSNDWSDFATDANDELWTAMRDRRMSDDKALSNINAYMIMGRTTMSVLLVCGTFGNVMTMVVMRGMEDAKKSTSHLPHSEHRFLAPSFEGRMW